jgi:hypothetical protein
MIKQIVLLLAAASSVFATAIPSFNGEALGTYVASAFGDVRYFNTTPDSTDITDVFSGVLYSAALRRADGNLDFYYQFNATGVLPLPIGKAEVTAYPFSSVGRPDVAFGARDDFSGFIGSAEFQSGGTVPTNSTDPHYVFAYLDYNPPILAGDHTSIFILRTQLPAYSLGSLQWLSVPSGPMQYQYIYHTQEGTVLRPDLPEVPEPGTWGMMATSAVGLIGLGAWRKRRTV